MAHRIDIELTSQRPDGSWTWRAAGARQPRGEVTSDLVPTDAKVGDVLRAEAEFDLDGIVVMSTLAQRTQPRSDDSRRIEVLGSRREAPAGVSVSLAPGSRRPRGDDDRRRRRSEGEDDTGPPRRSDRKDRERDGRRGPPGVRAGTDREGRPGRESRPGRPRTGGPSSERPDRAERPDRPERPRRPERPERLERPGRPRRPQPASTYRNAALNELRPEQLPVAEQLLRGGIPGLRSAIEEQNARAKGEGRDPVPTEPLLAMAEELLPRLNLATWKDRATAMRDAGKEAPLREVRSVVAGASAVALDDEGRALLVALREALDARVTALRQSWLNRVTTALDEGRVADALRVASRPPEPAARIPAEVAVRLAADASAAMSPEVPEERWLELLEVVVSSPVRRTVRPVGLPPSPSEQLLQAVHRSAGQVPELARLLGLPIPPPPGPRRPATVGARRT
jgi:hypothetical protein